VKTALSRGTNSGSRGENSKRRERDGNGNSRLRSFTRLLSSLFAITGTALGTQALHHTQPTGGSRTLLIMPLEYLRFVTSPAKREQPE
jgi:hypothetical protein